MILTENVNFYVIKNVEFDTYVEKFTVAKMCFHIHLV